MKEKMRKWLSITTLITLLPSLVGLFLWKRLPEELPVHFNAEGAVDGYASKPFAIFGIPLFLVAINFLMAFMACADPKNKGGQAVGTKPLLLALAIAPVVSIYGMSLTIGTALGYHIDASAMGLWLIAVLFIVIGNYLPKIRQNYFYGARLPWTLNNTENWDKTNRLTGRMMVLAGILAAIEAVFRLGGANGILVVVICVVVCITVVPTLYSYWLYRKEEESHEKQ